MRPITTAGPLFSQIIDGSVTPGRVMLRGVLFGGQGNETWYSPTGGIVNDFFANEAGLEHVYACSGFGGGCSAVAGVPGFPGSPGVPSMTVSIIGPSSIPEGTSGTWTAQVQDGVAPYGFEWFANGAFIGSGQTVDTGGSCGQTIELMVRATDNGGQVATATTSVYVTAWDGGFCQ